MDLPEHFSNYAGTDMMSLLLAQLDDEGGKVSMKEFENLFWPFAVAGTETLRNGRPGGMIALLTYPDAQQELRAGPELRPGAAEEMLWWWTPVMAFRRTATRKTSLADTVVHAGDKVVVSFLAANRDPAVFARPEVFDVLTARNSVSSAEWVEEVHARSGQVLLVARDEDPVVREGGGCQQ